MKNSPDAQQQQATTESKEVAQMQQECRVSAQELSRTQRQDGKQDAWKGHAQVASQAKAVQKSTNQTTNAKKLDEMNKNSEQLSSRSRR